MRITLAGRTYSSKKALINEHDRILWCMDGPDKLYTFGPEFNFLKAYYSEHYIIHGGPPIKGVYWLMDDYNNYRNICVLLTDGNTHDKLSKNPNRWACNTTLEKLHKLKLSLAMDNEIAGQMLAFRATMPKQCERCGATGLLDVDHDWMFGKREELKQEFIAGRTLEWYEDNTTSVILKDRAVGKAWQEYHKQNAVLRPLCKKCHNHEDKVEGK